MKKIISSLLLLILISISFPANAQTISPLSSGGSSGVTCTPAASASQLLYATSGTTCGGITGWTTNGTTTLTGGASTTLAVGGATIGSNALAVTGTSLFNNRITVTQATANQNVIASTGYSLTGSDASSLIDLAGTWNTTGVPTAIKLNIVNTAAGVGSLMIDLQKGGTSQFRVDNFGNGYTAGTMLVSTGSIMDFSGKIVAASGGLIGFSSSASLTASSYTIDTNFSRNAAGIVQVGTTAANASGSIIAANHYTTGTTGVIGSSAGVFDLGTAAVPIVRVNAGTSNLNLAAASTIGFASAGGPSNAYDVNISRAAAGALQIGTTAANASGNLALAALTAGTGYFTNSAGVFLLNNSGTLVFGAATDLSIVRDAADTLALRNYITGTNAQAFNIYQTTDGGSNYARLRISAGKDAANFLQIIGQTGGTGAITGLDIGINNTNVLRFSTTSATLFSLPLLFFADNTNDIGAVGATRPRNLYVGTNGTFGGNVVSAGYMAMTSGALNGNTGLYFAGGLGNYAQIQATADGVITVANYAGTSFGRLNFGGTTSSFPALKRSSAALVVRLADDSADAGLSASTLTASSSHITLPATAFVLWGSNGGITTTANGLFKITDLSGTDFGRLMFGGSTSSYPALKRVVNYLEVKLADDSGYAQLLASNFVESTGAVIAGINTTDSVTGLFLGSTRALGWGSTATGANGALDTHIYRTAAGIIAPRGTSTTSPATTEYYTYGASPPAAGAASTARLYADTSGGKIRLMVVFPSGAAQQIAIEP